MCGRRAGEIKRAKERERDAQGAGNLGEGISAGGVLRSARRTARGLRSAFPSACISTRALGLSAEKEAAAPPPRSHSCAGSDVTQPATRVEFFRD